MTWDEIQEKIEKELIGGYSPVQMKWLQTKVKLDSKNMREMSTEELRGFFKGRRDDVDDASLIRTFIWQSYLLLLGEELKPLKGNLRSFWYRELSPFYKYHKLLFTDETRAMPDVFREAFPETEVLLEYVASIMGVKKGAGNYNALLRGGWGRELYLVNKMGLSFDDFVLMGFFRFQDEFEFQDSREHFRIVGSRRPRLIFYTEKEGLFWLCKEFADKYGISAMASHGEPGYLTLEYFADKLRAKGVRNIEIIALTDYDPWGFNIAESFGEKLAEPVYGFKRVNTTHLTSLELFDKDKLDYIKRDLSKVSSSKKKQVADWVKLTGGINGEAYGVHVDHVEFDRVRDAVARWYESVK
ncbi:MAG: hypothetical protein AB1478_09175 [Nitrospirota bacterium]